MQTRRAVYTKKLVIDCRNRTLVDIVLTAETVQKEQ
jgi:hypothetical protein